MSNNKVVFLSDGVVVLRPLLKADLPFLLSCVNDPDVREYIGSYLPQYEVDEEEWLKKIGQDKEHNIVLAMEVAGAIIGVMGLHRINWKDRVAMTGAMIQDREHRGKGYGTRAKMLFLEYAFHELNLRKIRSGALEYNTASLRFNAKCGYKEEGRLRANIFKHGQYFDEVLTAVFREDFEPLLKEHKRKIAQTV